MEIKLDKIDNYEFSSFIKKLLPIDKFIFMKVGEENTLSSVYLPERDAVKLVTVKTSDLFGDSIGSLPAPLKVSFYNGSKVNDALDHFKDGATGSIRYQKLDDQLMASDFIINGSGPHSLTVNLPCADPSLSFMEMSKDEMSRAFDTSDKLFEFDLLLGHIDRMKSLFNLEKDEDVFELYLCKDGVGVRGNTFDGIISHSFEGDAIGKKVTVYKKYLNLLDKENYKLIVCDNKLVFQSLDTDTRLTVAVAITDD